MRLNIDFRKNVFEESKEYFVLGNLTELEYLFKYLQNLFEMTQNFVKTNVNYLISQYDEKQQKLLNRLQYLFLVGVVVAFITLGAFPGADFAFFDPAGQEIATGTMISFNLRTLLIYGSITVIVTLVISSIWMLLLRGRIKK
jgi:hypothetical protein